MAPDKKSVFLSQASYTSVARFIHWLMAILILATFIGAFLIDELPKSLKFTVVSLHKATGTGILLLVLRIGWRLVHKPPTLTGHGAGMARLASFGHFCSMR